jgi:formylglycine-generating enzyme required for sulfatase activity
MEFSNPSHNMISLSMLSKYKENNFILVEKVDALIKADFYISRYPIIENSTESFISCEKSEHLYRTQWRGAISYCNQLCRKYEVPPSYCDKRFVLIDNQGNQTSDVTKVLGFRLPTPYEWEYAAKGWSGRKDGTYFEVQKKFCRIPGLDFPISETETNFYQNGYSLISELAPNIIGIYGLLIYAKEWCYNSERSLDPPQILCKWGEYFMNYNNDIGYCVNTIVPSDDAKYPFHIVINRS